MKIHRAVVLVLMILFSLLLIFGAISYAVATWSQRSLVPLLVVIGVSALAGIAFSWRRYFPGRG
ncbi:MAG: hypothetical protein M3024_01595 [Candidatus Dormibacteraeota bacterium]|nr:hypothetical protein [Candidatus Dormibacteraeota bacterium]